MQQPQSFQCAKCRHGQCDIGEVYMPGGRWSKWLNVQGRKFTTASCKQCGLTEFYDAGKSSKLGNVFDFLIGG